MNCEDWNIDISDTHPEYLWVVIETHIKCVATGEVVVYLNKGILSKETLTLDFWSWIEGNWSCDCYRRDDFRTSGGTVCPDYLDDDGEPDDNAPCTQGEYLVNHYNPLTGTCHYKEF